MTSWLGNLDAKKLNRGNNPRFMVALVNDDWCVIDTENNDELIEEFDSKLDAEDYANYLNLM